MSLIFNTILITIYFCALINDFSRQQGDTTGQRWVFRGSGPLSWLEPIRLYQQKPTRTLSEGSELPNEIR